MSGKYPSVVLVLGAGASHSMGYPVGETLRKDLIAAGKHEDKKIIIANASSLDENQVTHFATTFRDSQCLSIDSFLARRPDLVNIGKCAIAVVLLDLEKEALLHSCSDEDTWYQYFFNQIAAEEWEKLDFSDYAVISFNYDRSLEHYLVRAMANSFDRSPEECSEKLQLSLRILHIYGTLGPCFPSEPDYFEYGSPVTPKKVKLAASRLRVIPEGRDEDEVLVEAQLLLENADSIAFLGFGFDTTNLRRLDSTRTCLGSVRRTDGVVARKIVATTHQLKRGEITEAMIATTGILEHTSDPFRFGFIEAKCLAMLRETQILKVKRSDG